MKSTDPLVEIDSCCDRFEACWIAQSSPPDFEEFLPLVSEANRQQLFRELVLVDVEYRKMHDLGVPWADWRARYPEFGAIVQELTRTEATGQERDAPPAARARGESTTLTSYDGPGSGREANIGNKHTGPTEPVPSCIGNYRIVGEISRGGMGVVYKAEQSSPHRFVALKVIRSDKVSPEIQDRFRAEAEAAASLDHPSIVPVFETGQDRGQHYLAMAYVSGGSLADAILETPMPGDVAARHCKKIAKAIHYAHRTGILHRDLKPSNVLIDQHGEPRVTDFGLAKRVETARELTVTGAVLGTPSYMAPEQARGEKEKVDSRSDVYSLGALLFALLTGRPPFQAEGAAATLLQVIENEAPPPRNFNPDIDPALEAICLKCIEKEPCDRYASMQAVADELENYLQGLPVAARSATSWTRFARRITRNPALGLLAVMMAITVVLGATLIHVALSQDPTAEDSAISSLRSVRPDVLYFVACAGPVFSVSKLLGTERTRRMELAILWCIRHVGRSVVPYSVVALQTLAFVLYFAMLVGVRALGVSESHPLLVVTASAVNLVALQNYLGWRRLRNATIWMFLALLLCSAALVCLASLEGIEFPDEYAPESFLPTESPVNAIVSVAGLATMLFSFSLAFALGLVSFHTSTHALDRMCFRAMQRTAAVFRSALGWVPWPLRSGELSYRFDPLRAATGPLTIAVFLLPFSLLAVLLLISLFCVLIPLSLVEKLRQILTPEIPVFSDLAAYLLSIAALVAMLLSRLALP